MTSLGHMGKKSPCWALDGGRIEGPVLCHNVQLAQIGRALPHIPQPQIPLINSTPHRVSSTLLQLGPKVSLQASGEDILDRETDLAMVFSSFGHVCFNYERKKKGLGLQLLLLPLFFRAEILYTLDMSSHWI